MEQHDDTRCDLCGAPLRKPAETCLCWRCLAAQVIGTAPDLAEAAPSAAPDRKDAE